LAVLVKLLLAPVVLSVILLVVVLSSVNCGNVVVFPDMLVLPAVTLPAVLVSLPVLRPVSLPVAVPVVFCTSLVVVVWPVSKIRLAIEPLAENVS
jgi:hypothetical protein